MNSKIDRVHLKKVGLTPFDIKLLTLLMKTGGEYPMPATVEGRAGVARSCAKNLVSIVDSYVRLTDEGRTVLSQLEQMAVQPKVEVDNR